MPTVTIWHATWCAPCKGTIERVVPRLREEGVEPAHPTEEAIERIVELCGQGSPGRGPHPRVRDVTTVKAP